MRNHIRLPVRLALAFGLVTGSAAAQWSIPSLDPWAPVIRAQDESADEGSVYDEPLESDRPDFTEASSVVGRGVLQIETGYTFAWDDEGDTQLQTHSAPETLFRYGVTDNLELRLVWNYAWERTTTAGLTEFDDGAEDLMVGTKVALTSQRDFIPESALILDFSTPTGGTPFTNTHAEYGMNYLYGWDLPGDKYLAGSLGYSTASQIVLGALPPPSTLSTFDRHNVFHASVTHGIPLVEPMAMYFEYFGLYYDGLVGGRPQNYANTGITYLFNNNLQFDARFGMGLNAAADDFFAGTGMVVRL